MKNNNGWYSVVLALLMTSFIIIIVSWVFRLILENMYDTRWMQDYLKAYSRAEGSMELALKKVKDNDFWFEEHIFPGIWEQKISELFQDKKKTFIWYEINSKADKIIWKTLEANSYAIYPLLSLTKPIFNISAWDSNSLVWNIIWNNWWMSGTGSFNWNLWKDIKSLDSSNNFDFSNKTINNFLSSSSDNYLVLYNAWNSIITYDLKSEDINNKFALEDISIIATWKVWDYKQNLKVDLNIANNLNLLKYSILSPEN